MEILGLQAELCREILYQSALFSCSCQLGHYAVFRRTTSPASSLDRSCLPDRHSFTRARSLQSAYLGFHLANLRKQLFPLLGENNDFPKDIMAKRKYAHLRRYANAAR